MNNYLSLVTWKELLCMVDTRTQCHDQVCIVACQKGSILGNETCHCEKVCIVSCKLTSISYELGSIRHEHVTRLWQSSLRQGYALFAHMLQWCHDDAYAFLCTKRHAMATSDIQWSENDGVTLFYKFETLSRAGTHLTQSPNHTHEYLHHWYATVRVSSCHLLRKFQDCFILLVGS